METLKHRPMTIAELHRIEPGKFKIAKLPTLDFTRLNNGGTIPAAAVVPDLSQPVLYQSSAFQTLTRFIYRNRYPLIAVGVGTVIVVYSINLIFESKKEKKRA